MLKKSLILASGSCLPEKVVTNEDFIKELETTDEWIRSRVGITSRRFLQDHESLDDIATQACQDALTSAGVVNVLDIDAIIVGTTTNPYLFPSLATLIQRKLGATNACAFDVQAVCSGFIYALSVADNMIKGGQFKKILVVGAEAMSRITDQKDRSTAVIFGDGAGAILLQATNTTEERGILSTHLYSDGSTDLLYTCGGPGSTESKGKIVMEGREVFKHAVTKLGQAVLAALEANSLTSSNIDWFIPHQANYRIIKAVSEHFDLPMEKVIVTLDHHGNTSAASIPLALDSAVKNGKIKEGHLLILEALGGGLTWGSAAIRW